MSHHAVGTCRAGLALSRQEYFRPADSCIYAKTSMVPPRLEVAKAKTFPDQRLGAAEKQEALLITHLLGNAYDPHMVTLAPKKREALFKEQLLHCIQIKACLEPGASQSSQKAC